MRDAHFICCHYQMYIDTSAMSLKGEQSSKRRLRLRKVNKYIYKKIAPFSLSREIKKAVRFLRLRASDHAFFFPSKAQVVYHAKYR